MEGLAKLRLAEGFGEAWSYQPCLLTWLFWLLICDLEITLFGHWSVLSGRLQLEGLVKKSVSYRVCLPDCSDFWLVILKLLDVVFGNLQFQFVSGLISLRILESLWYGMRYLLQFACGLDGSWSHLSNFFFILGIFRSHYGICFRLHEVWMEPSLCFYSTIVVQQLEVAFIWNRIPKAERSVRTKFISRLSWNVDLATGY